MKTMNLTRTRSAMWGRAFLTMCALILSLTLSPFAGQHRMSKDLEERKPTDQVDVIVQIKEVPTANHHQRLKNRGGMLKRDLGQFRGASYTGPASALADLADDPDVVYVSPDRPLYSTSTAVNDFHTASCVRSM